MELKKAEKAGRRNLREQSGLAILEKKRKKMIISFKPTNYVKAEEKAPSKAATDSFGPKTQFKALSTTFTPPVEPLDDEKIFKGLPKYSKYSATFLGSLTTSLEAKISSRPEVERILIRYNKVLLAEVSNCQLTLVNCSLLLGSIYASEDCVAFLEFLGKLKGPARDTLIDHLVQYAAFGRFSVIVLNTPRFVPIW